MSLSGVTNGLQSPQSAATQPTQQARGKAPDLDGDNDGTTAVTVSKDTGHDSKRLLNITA